jgi:hypothetical protein
MAGLLTLVAVVTSLISSIPLSARDTPPVGGCCIPPCNECLLLTETDCDAQGGDWMGEGSTCDPLPCPIWSACCFPDGHCEFITDEQCVAAGGEWNEPCVVCDPNPCEPPVPVIEGTWGVIKAKYR